MANTQPILVPQIEYNGGKLVGRQDVLFTGSIVINSLEDETAAPI